MSEKSLKSSITKKKEKITFPPYYTPRQEIPKLEPFFFFSAHGSPLPRPYLAREGPAVCNPRDVREWKHK